MSVSAEPAQESLALVLYQPPPTRELASRLAALAELRAEFARLEAAYNAEKARIREFEKRWKPAVGKRYAEIDSVRERMERLRRLMKLARAGRLDEAPKEAPPLEGAPSGSNGRPADDLRTLFRNLARRVHPDLADDFDERRRRHEFMSEATRAYRARDPRRLQWLLERWLATADPPRGRGVDAKLARTNQEVAWERYRIQELHHETAALGASMSAEIMRQCEAATREGRNFVAEMRNEALSELVRVKAEMKTLEEQLDEEFDASAAAAIRRRLGAR